MRKRIWLIFLICFCAVLTLGVFVGIVYRPYYQSQNLIRAIEEGNIEKVQRMLVAGVDPNIPDFPCSGGWYYFNILIEDAPELPLSVACKTGNLEMVQLLINHGAEVQGTHGTAWSPIQATVLQYREQAPELIKLLLENGAKTQGADGSYAPICLALQLRIPENADGKKDVLASEKITETVRILMDGSEKENARYAYFLIDSARQGNLPLVRWFLSEGWSKDTQYNGKTAYDYAIENGYADIAELVVP